MSCLKPILPTLLLCPAENVLAWSLMCFLPSLAVDDSAIIDCQFSDFYHTPPQGFEKILFEQQIFWAVGLVSMGTCSQSTLLLFPVSELDLQISMTHKFLPSLAWVSLCECCIFRLFHVPLSGESIFLILHLPLIASCICCCSCCCFILKNN